jgi:phosphatidylinositol-3-phosphatase
VTERAYARRRRAALPAALAALTFLVIVAGSNAPARWAGEQVAPAMTIVLPPAVPASAPPADAGLSEPPTDVLPLDAGAPVPAPPPVEPAPAAAEQAPADEPTERPAKETPAERAPAIRHVVLVVLAQTDLVALAEQAAASPDVTPAPYLTRELVPQGTLLTRYAAAAGGSLANGIALVSGQGPTQATLTGCPVPAGAAPDAPPPDVTPDEVGANGQQLGDGCVYPFATGTVTDQLVGAGLDWRAYVEDAAGPCPATPRNPFAYFHSLLDTGACARRVGGLDRLDADLARGSRAPALMYVVPGACRDGRPEPCAPGAPTGPAAADAFLRDLVPRVLTSPAYADGGLLVVTSDGPPSAAPATGAGPPSAAATPANPGPATYPNVGDPAVAGAGRVGALLVGEPVRAGARDDEPAGHFALLRAISDLFALEPLAYAANSTVDWVNWALSSTER